MTKAIKGHPDYYVSDKGYIVSYKGVKPRKLIPDVSNGYLRVTIDGRKRYVADIVAEHFFTKPVNPYYKLFYIDGNIGNCSTENLIYLSPSDIQRFSAYTVEYRRQVLGARE